jgi:hypothetical protein
LTWGEADKVAGAHFDDIVTIYVLIEGRTSSFSFGVITLAHSVMVEVAKGEVPDIGRAEYVLLASDMDVGSDADELEAISLECCGRYCGSDLVGAVLVAQPIGVDAIRMNIINILDDSSHQRRCCLCWVRKWGL